MRAGAGAVSPRAPRAFVHHRRPMAEPHRTPLTHPAFLVTILVAAACVVVTLSYRLGDPDIWQHMAVGKAIWSLHRVPSEHLWTWPTYGQPDVTPSWLYRVLLWPFYASGGIVGVFVLRWLLALAAFAVVWATARQLGARGLTALAVIVACSLSYRARSQLRPEMLVAVLLACQLWLLERRRASGDRPAIYAGLIVIACLWANVHLSYFIGLALIGVHAVLVPAPPGRGLAGRVPLLLTLAASVAASFVNPYGARALLWPFEYWTTWRHESIYATLPELRSFFAVWRVRLVTGLPLLLALWPVLVLWRPRGRRFDPVEAVTCVMFTTLTLFAQRFAAFYAIAAAPYVAPDVAARLGTWTWPRRFPAPAQRAALVSAACVLVCVPSWLDPRYPFGIAWEWPNVPVGACEAIAREGVHGPLFNPHYFGGYILWRFWPDRDRLPFIDIHATGTPEDRDLTGFVLGEPRARMQPDARRHFQAAVIDGHLDRIINYRLPDAFDADTAWVLIFRDDAAELFVRRHGPNAAIAESIGYRFVAGGAPAWAERFRLAAADPASRAAMRAELDRASRESPENSWAEAQLGTLAWLEGDRAGARRHLERAARVAPRMEGVQRRLGYIALAEGRWRDAIVAMRRELALGTPVLDAYTRIGQAYEGLGNPRQARGWFRRALRADPGDAAARAGLDRVSG